MSGLKSQLGIKKETIYGTFIAPSKFLPFTSQGLALEKTAVASQGIRAGRMFQSQSLYIDTTRQGAGAIVLELLNKGMGPFFDLLHGNVVTPTLIVGATTAFRQTHDIGLTAPNGKSLSIQEGIPEAGGTVNPHSFLGCKITQWQIALTNTGLATCTFTFDVRDEDTAQSLGVASFATGAIPFAFKTAALTIGGSPAAKVREITISGTQGQATDRFHLGNSGIKDEPVVNAFADVTAQATVEYTAADHARFKNETVSALVLSLTGADIEAGKPFACGITLSAAQQISSGPTVDGPGLVTQQVNFQALYTVAAAPVSIAYDSTDSAL